MSAKRCNFAAEIAKYMEISEITHTAYRCRRSEFTTGKLLRCMPRSKYLDNDKPCKECVLWQPSQVVEDYFNKETDRRQTMILSEILLERKKRGTY